MKRSTDRILTTHMGSLPRPDLLADLLVAQAEGRPTDDARLPALTEEAMDRIVRRQLDCGIDVGNDGEMPRSTFFGYITERMSGFGGRSNRRPILDMQQFPKWWQNFLAELLDIGVDCFKTDFGERIQTEGVVYHDGSNPRTMHNA